MSEYQNKRGSSSFYSYVRPYDVPHGGLPAYVRKTKYWDNLNSEQLRVLSEMMPKIQHDGRYLDGSEYLASATRMQRPNVTRAISAMCDNPERALLKRVGKGHNVPGKKPKYSTYRLKTILEFIAENAYSQSVKESQWGRQHLPEQCINTDTLQPHE